jgi:hypothetical protein
MRAEPFLYNPLRYMTTEESAEMSIKDIERTLEMSECVDDGERDILFAY